MNVFGEGVIGMVQWRLKSCPRCGSDMFIEQDFDIRYEKCLMCSYTIDLERVPVKQPVAAGQDCYDDEDDYEEDEE